jgi:hypothetical protein
VRPSRFVKHIPTVDPQKLGSGETRIIGGGYRVTAGATGVAIGPHPSCQLCPQLPLASSLSSHCSNFVPDYCKSRIHPYSSHNTSSNLVSRPTHTPWPLKCKIPSSARSTRPLRMSQRRLATSRRRTAERAVQHLMSSTLPILVCDASLICYWRACEHR